MPRKSSRKPFRAVKAVKAKARQTLGTPPPTRRQPGRKTGNTEKHKPTLGNLLADEP
jgi:hypothetical protein